MPIVDGKIVRARYTSLKLNELSSVDRPAQPGARATILKRDNSVPPVRSGSWLARQVAKYVGTDDGAHTFNEVMRENRFSDAIWPLADAFSQAVRSIVGDTAITAQERDSKITTSVDEFLAAVRQLDPPEIGGDMESQKVEKQLMELIRKEDENMPKSIEELTREVEKLTGQLTAANAQVATLTTEKAAAETARTAAEGERDTAKAALVEATDETLKVGDREVKKSAVGEDTFAMFKAQEDRAQLATFEKRAGEEFGHLPGTSAEKALVLKGVEALPEEAKKSAIAIFTAAESMAKSGFSRIGSTGEAPASVRKAREDFDSKVAEIAKRDDCSQIDAMRKARIEHEDLFQAMQDAGADA